MLQKIAGINQSEKYGFYLLTDDNVWDVTKISENFQEAEDIIKNFALDDEHIDCIKEGKKLDAVIKELREANKKIDGKVDGLKIDDEHVDVVSKKKKLNLVLAELDEKNSALDALIKKNIEVTKTYRDAEAELAEALGQQVQKHKLANDRLEKIL